MGSGVARRSVMVRVRAATDRSTDARDPATCTRRVAVNAGPAAQIQPLECAVRRESARRTARGMKLADDSCMNRWPLMLQQALLPPRDPEAICHVVRLAYGLLLAVAAGTGAWLLLSRI